MSRQYSIKDVIPYINFGIQDIIDENNHPAITKFPIELSSEFYDQLTKASYGIEDINEIVKKACMGNESLNSIIDKPGFNKSAFKGITQAVLDKLTDANLDVFNGLSLDFKISYEFKDHTSIYNVNYNFGKKDLIQLSALFRNIEDFYNFVYTRVNNMQYGTPVRSLLFSRNKMGLTEPNYYKVLKLKSDVKKCIITSGASIIAEALAGTYELISQVHDRMPASQEILHGMRTISNEDFEAYTKWKLNPSSQIPEGMKIISKGDFEEYNKCKEELKELEAALNDTGKLKNDALADNINLSEELRRLKKK